MCCTDENDFQEKYEKLVSSAYKFNKILNKEMLLINAEIFNTSIELVNRITEFASNIKNCFEYDKKNKLINDNTFINEHDNIYKKKLEFDNVLRKFSGISS